MCGIGFLGCRGAGGLRDLYGDVCCVSDAYPPGGGEQCGQACSGAGAGGQELGSFRFSVKFLLGHAGWLPPFFRLAGLTTRLLGRVLLGLLLLLAHALQLFVDLLRGLDAIGVVGLGRTCGDSCTGRAGVDGSNDGVALRL